MTKRPRNRTFASAGAFLLALHLACGAASAQQVPVPFACTGEAFVVQDAMAQLTMVDQSVAPFIFTPIGGANAFQYNNLGFRAADGLLYAAKLLPAGNSGIIKIDSTGAVFGPTAVALLPTNLRFAAGDVTPDSSTMYLNESGAGRLYKVALPGLTLSGSVAISGATGVVFDWAVNPTNGLLYGGDQTGAAGAGQLASLNPTTGVRTDVTVSGCAPVTPTCTASALPSGIAFGGAWFNAAGRLFLYRNGPPGTIYEIDLSGPKIVRTQTGPSSSNNDGAACTLPLCEDGVDFPTCGGPCPAGEQCVTDPSGGSACTCQPPLCEDGSGGASCNGPCPNPNDRCVDDGSGAACTCQPPPCESGSGGASCNGPCPNPNDRCVDDGSGSACTCQPPPCESGSGGASCNGPCPNPNDRCVDDGSGSACTCQPPPCESGSGGASCNGPCPNPNDRCVDDGSGAACTCQPPPCESGSGGASCNGPCPNPNDRCVDDGSGAACTCQPPPCESGSGGASCNGPCPNPNDRCVDDGSGAACTCQPPPCESGSGGASCNGPCPNPNDRCVDDGSGAACTCQPPPCESGSGGASCNGPCPNPNDRCVDDGSGAACTCQPAACDLCVIKTCGGRVTCDASGHTSSVRQTASECTACGPGPYGCDEKPAALRLRYLGGDCSATTNTQEGKFECTDGVPATDPVRIVVSKDGSTIFLDTGEPANVTVGTEVEAAAANAGESKLGSSTLVDIFDASGDLVQSLDIHTSCSKPLNVGDVFGAVEVVGITDETGNVFPGENVEYTYAIANHGGLAVTNVTVFDSQLGNVTGSPIDSIGPGEAVALTMSASVTVDTENTVTVTADGCPEFTASASVTIDETSPACKASCKASMKASAKASCKASTKASTK